MGVTRKPSSVQIAWPNSEFVYRDKGDEKDIKYYFRFIPFIIFIPVNSLLLSSSWKRWSTPLSPWLTMLIGGVIERYVQAVIGNIMLRMIGPF